LNKAKGLTSQNDLNGVNVNGVKSI